MANPQKENGYTAIAHELLEAIIIYSFTAAELSIFLHIVRKTYGYGKKEDGIALSQFVTATGFSKKTVCVVLKKLQLVKCITLVAKGNSKSSFNVYKINKNYDLWQLVKRTSLVKLKGPTSEVQRTQLVTPTSHTIDNTIDNKRENLKFLITRIPLFRFKLSRI